MLWWLLLMQSKFVNILRWAGAVVMLLLIVFLIIEGTWAIPLHHSWPFVILVIIATILLFIAVFREIALAFSEHSSANGNGDGKGKWRWQRAMAGGSRLGALSSHLGLALVLLGGMLGAVVETDVQMVVDSHATERVAYTKRGETVVLPFSVALRDFCIDYYADGTSPKQFTSTFELTDAASKETEILTSSVNHPAHYQGWWIYQSNYDREQGEFCILQMVRDPWLPVVYIGLALMTLGALVETRKAWHSWKVLPVTILLAAVFTAASLARVELGTLVPALRSLWFFPHILIYMIAYSLMAIALVMALLQLSPTLVNKWHFLSSAIAQKLFTTTSSLLLMGMICGAVWAKDAWGQYWTWDAKECWAAVTWLITIVGSHLPNRSSVSGRKVPVRLLVVLLLAFASMQITWYGVNYLPSAAYSMHTYNRSGAK